MRAKCHRARGVGFSHTRTPTAQSEASSKRPPAPSKRNHAALLDPAHLFDDFPDDDDDEDDSKRRRPVPPPPLTTEDLTLLTAAALELVGCPAGWKATDDQMRQLFDDAIRVGSALAITAGLGDGVHFDLRGEVICARCSHSMDLRGFAVSQPSSSEAAVVSYRRFCLQVVDESGAFDHSQVVCRSCCWTLEEAHEVPLGRNAQPERIKALVAQWERTKLLPLPEIILMEEVIPCVYPVGMRLPVGGEERLYVTEDEICDMVTDFARHDKGLYGKAVELAAEAQSGGYVQVNVPDRSEVVARLNGAMEAMRRCRSVKANRRMELLFWEVTRQFLCRDSTCLLLLTLSEGTGTRPHADPTEALNFAVAVLVGAAGEELKRQISSGARPVLASWLFVHPSLAEEVSALYQYLGYAHAGFATPEKNAEGTMLHQAADQALFDAVLRRFGNRVIAGQSGVFVLEQRVGDMVMVPPGWVHTVINRLVSVFAACPAALPPCS